MLIDSNNAQKSLDHINQHVLARNRARKLSLIDLEMMHARKTLNLIIKEIKSQVENKTFSGSVTEFTMKELLKRHVSPEIIKHNFIPALIFEKYFFFPVFILDGGYSDDTTAIIDLFH